MHAQWHGIVLINDHVITVITVVITITTVITTVMTITTVITTIINITIIVMDMLMGIEPSTSIFIKILYDRYALMTEISA